jgi:cation:H+ antiporter
MYMLVTIALFLVGLFILIKAADVLVSGASAVAFRFGISPLVVGLTIVAFGTSAPELIVSVLASMSGATDIAVGNVVGSNITNILLILGVSAAVFPLTVQKTTIWKEIPFALLAAVVFTVMAHDVFLNNAASSFITRGDGIVLISFFALFLYYIVTVAKNAPQENVEPKSISTLLSIVYVIAGVAGLVVGGKLIVDSATAIAASFGISETLIGLTVVAVGTSLPELATSIVAALKRQADIAVGNVVGSNIFNVFWIIGMSAVIAPLPIDTMLTTDMVVMVVATLLLFVCLFVGKRHVVDRWQGVLFVLLYVAYTAFLVVRG